VRVEPEAGSPGSSRRPATRKATMTPRSGRTT